MTQRKALTVVALKKNFKGEKLIALLELLLLVALKDKVHNCGGWKNEAVRVQAYLLSVGAEEICEAYDANRMSNGAHD